MVGVDSGVANATRARDGPFRGLKPTAKVSRRYRGEDLKIVNRRER
jgi:hypothetical protein